MSAANNKFIDGSRWTDKSFATTYTKLGANNKPDFDYTNLGLLFPQNDPSEIIYIIDQMDHAKQLGTALRLHLHFIQSSANIPNFVCEYKYYNNGAAVPGSFTTIQTANGDGPLFTYPGSGSILQLIPFPEIPAPDPENISANLEMKIYRNDNVVTGDVLVKYVDYHYLKDARGSRMEFVK